MSTRSLIGIIPNKALPTYRNPQNIGCFTDPTKIEVIYCHFDGYPSGVGKTLLENWMGAKKVRALLALGDLSSLGTVIGEKHDFDTHSGYRYDPKTGNSWYDEDSPSSRGWCCAYGRDRGETGVEAKKYYTYNEVCRDHGWTEWIYLYDVKHHKWLFASTRGNAPFPLHTLTAKKCERD